MVKRTRHLRGLIPSRDKRLRKRWAGLVGLMLLGWGLITTLTSCAWLPSKPPIVMKPKSNLPPSALLLDCEQPSLSKVMQTAAEYEKNPLTNLDLLIYAVKTTEAIASCTLDKRALRKWKSDREAIK